MTTETDRSSSPAVIPSRIVPMSERTVQDPLGYVYGTPDQPDQTIPAAQQFVIPYIGKEDPSVRMAVLKALANDAGLRLPDTILPEGTALLPVGEENRRALKAKLDQLPDLHNGLRAYRARLEAEKPVDAKVLAQGVRMDSKTGQLYDKSTPQVVISYTQPGFAQLAPFIRPSSIRNGFPENILALPNGLRSQVVNHWASSTPRQDRIVLRTFFGGNGRLLRGVTGETHSLLTGDDVAVVDALLAMQPGAKMRATREAGGRVSEIEVIWPMLDRELRVGDVAHGGIRIRNSETKAGSLKVEAFTLRVLCYNFTTAFSQDTEDEEVSLSSLRHVGDLRPKLARAIAHAQKRIEPLVHAFGDAFKDALPVTMPTRGEVLEKVGKVFELPATTLERAAALWDADGLKTAGDTRAGLVNALTRASQEQGISDAGETERTAGRIILDGWAALA